MGKFQLAILVFQRVIQFCWERSSEILTTYVWHDARRDENSDVRPGWTKKNRKGQKLQGYIHIVLK